MRTYQISIFYLILALAFALNISEARAQVDSVFYQLEDVYLTGTVNKSGMKVYNGIQTRISSELIKSMPMSFGSADPLNVLSFQPGIQTVSEYQSGIHICGGEDSHNYISIGESPVFNAKHLMGLFSVFNATHYSGVFVSKTPDFSSNRIGGIVRMELPDTTSKSVCGDFSIGLMALQGTLGLKLSDKVWAIISARQSYMNLVYGRWMKLDENPLSYTFGDYNATLNIIPSRNDQLKLNFYLGWDKVGMKVNEIGSDISSIWGNALASIEWNHESSKCSIRNTLYFSGYLSRVNLFQTDLDLYFPNHIESFGYKGKLTLDNFSFWANSAYYDVIPQTPYIKNAIFSNNPELDRQKGLELSIGADYHLLHVNDLSIKLGLKGDTFLSNEKQWYFGVSPLAYLSYDFHRYGKVTCSAGYGNQYLFHTSMSNAGIPVDFYFLTGKHSEPQSSIWINAGYSAELLGGAFILSADLHFKSLFNQVEYMGTLFDFITASYNLDDFLLKGKGLNYGGSIMLQKVSGQLTGWISYSYGRALRTFDSPEYPGIYPAYHDKPHEIDFVCVWRKNRWNVSSTFVYTSGSPFTAPESLYINSGSIITKYGDYNACRMRPYIRMDMSVGFALMKNKHQEGTIFLSVYNIMARKNDVMYRLVANDDSFAFRPMSFMLKIIPSISYCHKF